MSAIAKVVAASITIRTAHRSSDSGKDELQALIILKNKIEYAAFAIDQKKSGDTMGDQDRPPDREAAVKVRNSMTVPTT
jgi:hypothetical protein